MKPLAAAGVVVGKDAGQVPHQCDQWCTCCPLQIPRTMSRRRDRRSAKSTWA
jgi:hypothetical protein